MTQPGSPGLSPEAAAFFQSMGLTPGGGGGSSSAPASKGNVYLGAKTSFGRGKADPDGLRTVDRRTRSTTVNTKPVESADADFYALSIPDLRAFQQRLIDSGVAGPDDLVLGDHDDKTLSAFRALYERSAAYLAANKKMTPNDILEQIGAANRAAGRVGGGPADIRQGNQTVLSAGADLEAVVQDAARTRLGRKLRKNEAQRFIGIYQDIQRRTGAQAGAASDAAATGQDVTTVGAPNAGVSATNFVDTQFATEAGAHDVANAFDTFKALIGA
jgi:hypothetical protein